MRLLIKTALVVLIHIKIVASQVVCPQADVDDYKQGKEEEEYLLKKMTMQCDKLEHEYVKLVSMT